MLTVVNLKAKEYTNNELFTQSTIAYVPFTIGPIESKTLYGQSSTKSMDFTLVGNKETISWKTFDNTFVLTQSLVYSATGNIATPGFGTLDGLVKGTTLLVYTAGGSEVDAIYHAISGDHQTNYVPMGAKGSVP